MRKTYLPITAGIGLRYEHLDDIISGEASIAWLELLADNHFHEVFRFRKKVAAIAERYPVTLHSVGLSLGGLDPIDKDYLAKLLEAKQQFKPALISEHLCFTSAHGHHFHDLLPLPYTEEAINHLVPRIREVQDYLGQQILIENVSSYISYKESELSEFGFMTEIAERADCFILLDVNNIYVTARNHLVDPAVFLPEIPFERVKEIHLAGFSQDDELLIDTHDNVVADDVWELYRRVVSHVGPIPTLIEWDSEIPPLQTLLDEARKAQCILDARRAQLAA